MPFDTSMYQNFRGGTGLASLAQGVTQGLDIANQRKQQEAQAKQLELQQQTAERQKQAFETEQADLSRKRRMELFQNVGETAGNLMSIQDPQAAEAEWGNVRTNLINSGLAKEQDLPTSFQAAKPMVGFYHTKYQQAQEKAALETQKSRAEISKLHAEARKAGSVGVGGSVAPGKAPPGYRFKVDGSLEAIPGGPAAGKAEKQVQMEKQQAGIVVQDLGRAMNLLNDSSTASGPFVGKLSYVPGSDAWQLQSMLDSVKANVGFDKLQAMRAASPTGGALGGISDKETAMLQSTAGKLDVNLPPEVLSDNMKRLANQYNDIVHGPGNGPERFQLSFDESGNPVAKNEKRKSGLGINEARAGVAPRGTPAPQVFKTNEIEW